jgi:hypothetical protein
MPDTFTPKVADLLRRIEALERELAWLVRKDN